MDKEDILAKSRKENKNRDQPEQEIHVQAGAIAGSVGAVVCCVITLVSYFILGDYLLSPWVIYYSILGTEWFVRYSRLKRRSDLAAGILFLAAFVVNFVALILRMREAAA